MTEAVGLDPYLHLFLQPAVQLGFDHGSCNGGQECGFWTIFHGRKWCERIGMPESG